METRPTQKYNQAYTLNFNLYEVDGIDMRIDATFASGDIVIMKDEGAEANTTNLPTDEGTGYSLVLTSTEMSAARIVVYLIDQTATKVWLDIAIAIETYGDASAQHAFDLDTSSVAQTGDSFARLGAPAGASIAADLVVIDNFVDDLESRVPDTISLANINNEVLDVLTVDTFAEPSSVPAATSSLKDKINWLFILARNKLTQTATTAIVRNDADSSDVGTSTVSDDATTATRGEWS